MSCARLLCHEHCIQLATNELQQLILQELLEVTTCCAAQGGVVPVSGDHQKRRPELGPRQVTTCGTFCRYKDDDVDSVQRSMRLA